MTSRPPQAPKGLGNEGRKFWRAVISEWRFRPDELRILARACRILDTLAKLDEELQGADMIMRGSRGMIANPLLTERRLHEETLARLIRQLSLADGEGDLANGSRSSAGRTLAMARWRKGPSSCPPTETEQRPSPRRAGSGVTRNR
jgi:hypothetical protein